MSNFLLLGGGLVGLILGAELFVRGAAKLALTLGVSPLIVGLTIVSIGTSAPELVTTVQSSWLGVHDIAVGNIIGSNIFNILGVLGISAMITPLALNSQLLRQEIPIMLGLSLLLVFYSIDDGRLSFFNSLILTILMISYVIMMIWQSKTSPFTQDVERELENEIHLKSRWDAHWGVQIFLILIGSFILIKGSNFLVEGAVNLAKSWKVDEVLIGLTIVAIGTSLPELATSIIAAIRKQQDIAVGNVIGSNIFNIVGCLGVAGIVSPHDGLLISDSVLKIDLWVMLATSFALLPVFIGAERVMRSVGFMFSGYYVIYVVYLILEAYHHQLWISYLKNLLFNGIFPLTIIVFTIKLIQTVKR